MLSNHRSWLGRALAAGLVTATTIATPIAASALPVAGIAEPDGITVAEDSDLGQIDNFFDVLLNDLTGAEGKPIITDYTQGAKGTVGEVRVGDKIVQLTYVPNADASGTDAFTYTVTQDGTTETETVTVHFLLSQLWPIGGECQGVTG